MSYRFARMVDLPRAVTSFSIPHQAVHRLCAAFAIHTSWCIKCSQLLYSSYRYSDTAFCLVAFMACVLSVRFDHLRMHRPLSEAQDAPILGETGLVEALIFPVSVGSPDAQTARDEWRSVMCVPLCFLPVCQSPRWACARVPLWPFACVPECLCARLPVCHTMCNYLWLRVKK